MILKSRMFQAASSKAKKAAFTLTEIVICVAIISTVLVAVLGILPIGMDVSRKAMDHTVVATILEDVYNRLQGEPLTEADASFSPAFFDDLGVYLVAPKDGADAEETARYTTRRTYRAEVSIVRFASAPANTSNLHAVRVRLYWPLDGNGNPLGDDIKPKTEVTFPVTTLAGTDWQNIDPAFRPKIEH